MRALDRPNLRPVAPAPDLAQPYSPEVFADTVLWEAFATVQAGQIPGHELAYRIGHLIATNWEARQALTALTYCPHGRAFAAALATRTTGAAGVQARLLAATLAYGAADWGVVRDSLTRAEAELGDRPAPVLLTLLSRALSQGVPPAQVRTLCVVGARTLAVRFGIVPLATAAVS